MSVREVRVRVLGYGYVGENRKVEGESMRQQGDNDESCRVREG
jgi:hypothetical protein